MFCTFNYDNGNPSISLDSMSLQSTEKVSMGRSDSSNTKVSGVEIGVSLNRQVLKRNGVVLVE